MAGRIRLAVLALAMVAAVASAGVASGQGAGSAGAAAVASPAGAGERYPASRAVSGPDAPSSSPAARPGSPLASRRSLSAKGLKRKLRRGMRSAGGASGAWVYDMRKGERPVVFGDSARSGRILASNTKLFTTAAFLERFGAEGRLETEVRARGRRSGPDGRVLRGDLVVEGDGDPALGTPGFANARGLPLTSVGELAAAVRRSGIERVRGRVLADDSVFDRKRRSGPYLSPLSGLSFNSGYAPSGGYASKPELEAARELHRRLKDEGLRISGEPGRLGRKAKPRGEAIAAAASPQAANLAAATNKPSNNFFAEMLLKRVGAGAKRAGTTSRGANRAEKVAREYGAGATLADGSGLSRGNRASPKQVGRLLVGIQRRAEWRRALFSSLAVAGRDGTLDSRMEGTAAAGRCHAKTGTLSDVSALSGYCETKGGGLVAFSFLMNSVNTDSARNAQDRMTAAIARYGR